MRLTCPRITVRRLMILVAAVAIVFGGGIEFKRLRWASRVYNGNADSYRQVEAAVRANAGQPRERWVAEDGEVYQGHPLAGMQFGKYRLTTIPPPPGYDEQLAVHYARLRAKYERASRYPWLAVPPDPPSHIGRRLDAPDWFPIRESVRPASDFAGTEKPLIFGLVRGFLLESGLPNR